MRHECGQSAIEFLVVSACVALGLLLPWMDGRSPAEWLLGALADLAAAHIAWLKVI